MKETREATGDTGRIIIRDRTDEAARTVEVLLQSTSPVAADVSYWLRFGPWSPDIPQPIRTKSFKATTVAQRLWFGYVGYAPEFIFHLMETGKTQLGGPTEVTVDLTGGVSTVKIKVNGVYKTAVPYVKHEGVWKPADAHVNDNGTWKRTM